MDISIIVPIYNVEKYVEECINSILNQKTNKMVEVILVNDGSKDKSREKIKLYEKLHNVEIVDKENGGLSSARNVGLKLARGKYVIFIDSDDYLESNYVEKMYSFIEKNELDVLFGGYKYLFEDGTTKKIKCIYKSDIIMNNKSAIVNLFKKKTFRAEVCDDIFNRKFLINNNLFFEEGIINEDEDFTQKVLIKANMVGYINYNGYIYRQRNGSITKFTDYDKSIKSKIIIINNFIKIFYLENNEKIKRFIYWRILLLFDSLILNLNNSTKNYNIKNIEEFLIRNSNIYNKFKINFITNNKKTYIKYIKIKENVKNKLKKII